MNPETRNLVAAISLSMAVLIGYQLLFVDPKKDQIKQENVVNNLSDNSNIPIPSNDNSVIVTGDDGNIKKFKRDKKFTSLWFNSIIKEFSEIFLTLLIFLNTKLDSCLFIFKIGTNLSMKVKATNNNKIPIT